MNLKKVRIDDLKPAEYNPRVDLQPEDKEYQQIIVSIEEFGYVDPIIINKDYTIIGGHQRVKVLKDLGYDEIDAIVIDIDKKKEKALNIALNKITGRWDFPKLELALTDLKEQGLDLTITGFEPYEIKKLFSKLKTDEELLLEDKYEVIITCENEEKQKEVYEKLIEEGYDCRVLTL